MDHDIYDDGPHDGIGGGHGRSAEDVRESALVLTWAVAITVAFAVAGAVLAAVLA